MSASNPIFTEQDAADMLHRYSVAIYDEFGLLEKTGDTSDTLRGLAETIAHGLAKSKQGDAYTGPCPLCQRGYA